MNTWLHFILTPKSIIIIMTIIFYRWGHECKEPQAQIKSSRARIQTHAPFHKNANSLKFFFNWRKIALQCCVGFCRLTTWISHNYTYVLSFLSLLPLLPSLSSRLSQGTRLGSLCYTAASHCLFYTRYCMYVTAVLSVRPTLSFPLCVHKSFSTKFTSSAFLDSICVC